MVRQELLGCARKFVGDDFDLEKDVETWSGVMAVSPGVSPCPAFDELVCFVTRSMMVAVW